MITHVYLLASTASLGRCQAKLDCNSNPHPLMLSCPSVGSRFNNFYKHNGLLIYLSNYLLLPFQCARNETTPCFLTLPLHRHLSARLRHHASYEDHAPSARLCCVAAARTSQHVWECVHAHTHARRAACRHRCQQCYYAVDSCTYVIQLTILQARKREHRMILAHTAANHARAHSTAATASAEAGLKPSIIKMNTEKRKIRRM